MTDIMNIPAGYFDVIAARNPRWSDASRRTITLEVLFGWCGEGGSYIAFTASPDDGEPHGRRLFADARAGKYGAVAEPPALTVEEVQAEMALRTRQATAALDSLRIRQETLQDALALGMGDDDARAKLGSIDNAVLAWKKYRVLISQVPAQAGYPQSVDWPDEPDAGSEDNNPGRASV